MGARAEVAGGSGRRSAAPVIAATVIAVTAIAVIAVSSREGTVERITANDGGASTVAPTQLQTAVEWVDGLAAGLILTSDVTSRLDAQDPEMASVVGSAWRDLRSSGSQAQMHEALAWVDGLAAGLITPSDVTSRLDVQDPAMARIVTATWADLGLFANRSV